MMTRAGLLLGVMLGLAGCATRDRVVLLPDPSGKVGKIAVIGEGSETVLDKPYASARTGGLTGSVNTETLDAAEVRKTYAAELGGLPPRPVSFNLYFVEDSDQLTPQSRERIPEILAEIGRRAAAEVVVIGHTDTRATDDYNDQLSMARAVAVRDQLVALGLQASRISTAGRGERELAIPTADGVDEPRNRRAEINVR